MNEPREEFSVDLERLLTPISAEQPAGESLRYEGTYDRVQEARKEDDPTLPQGVWQADLKRADWESVESICREALETRTKDLQLAVWLMEAWLHLHGFAGAREGVRLIAGLCESFWDGLYPELEEDSLEFRLSPLEWVNNRLTLTLKQIPISHPEVRDRPAHTWSDWEAALILEGQIQRDVRVLRAAEAEGKPTLTQIRGSILLTPKPFFVALYAQLGDLIDAIVGLERLLEEKGSRTPNLNQFKNMVQEIQQLASRVLEEREGEGGDDTETPGILPTAGQAPVLGDEKGTYEAGPIRSRTEAYQRLSEIADYLAQVEPHSPTPYLVRRAVAWGSMTVMELLQELVQDQSDLQAIYSLLGIRGDSAGPPQNPGISEDDY
ncbi:MAG: type VI secretion system protein TssA [bacterium]|nr:type VI secretion system protein TssA [bacterium]